MNKKMSVLTVASLVAASTCAALVGAGSASAYTGAGSSPSPWTIEGGASSTNRDNNAKGGIVFYDGSGNRVTSGSISSAPMSTYAVGLSNLRTGDGKATLAGFLATPGVNPGLWNNETLGASATSYNTTYYPTPSDNAAPAFIKNSGLPVATGSSLDQTLEQLTIDYPQTASATGYTNVYEIRMFTSGGANGGPGASYDYADIAISGSTWTEVYSPDIAPVTVTSVATHSPTTGIVDEGAGSVVTLTDTLTPSGATGTVQFQDNGTNVGAAVTVVGGVATTTDTVSTTGTHSITAVFTPAAVGNVITPAYSTSSATDSFSVGPYQGNTATTLTASASPVIKGASETFNITVARTGTPTGTPTGTVTVTDGTNSYTATLSGGSASITTSTSSWAVGGHNFTATYNGDSHNLTSSSSPVTSVTVNDVTWAQDHAPLQTDIAAGALAITTPYGPGHALVVPTLQLDPSGTFLRNQVAFGDGSIANGGTANSGPATLSGAGINPKAGAGDIQVVDTRNGNPGWTVSAYTSGLARSGGPVAGQLPSQYSSISGENVGLYGLAADYVPGNAISATDGNVPAVSANRAANLPVAPTDGGNAGLGGVQHTVASTQAGYGTGTVGFHGTLEITAPTSTVSGTYTGEIVFTIA
jgi:hypothetical protein